VGTNPLFARCAGRSADHPGAFDKLVLVSWLKDNGQYVIFVQNSEGGAIAPPAGPSRNVLRATRYKLCEGLRSSRFY
jgi:hypothetical protein